jgi:hypothetical protein
LRTERQLRVQKQNGSFQTHPHSHFTLSASALRIVVRIFRNPEYDTVKYRHTKTKVYSSLRAQIVNGFVCWYL